VEIKKKEPTYSMYAGVNVLLTTESIALAYTRIDHLTPGLIFFVG
jgi:hypothetical protein